MGRTVLSFHSVSARRDLEIAPIQNRSSRVVEIGGFRRPTLVCIGEMLSKEHLNLSQDLGFDVIERPKNLNRLIHAKALIFNDIKSGVFGQCTGILNFTVSYGIPTAWLHRYVEPIHWMWNFRLCCVGDVPAETFWRHLCQIII